MKLNAENAIILIPENQDRQTFVEHMLNYLADFGALLEDSTELDAIDSVNVKSTIWLESEDFGFHIVDIETSHPSVEIAEALKMLLHEAALQSEYDNFYFSAALTKDLLKIRTILEYSK